VDFSRDWYEGQLRDQTRTSIIAFLTVLASTLIIVAALCYLQIRAITRPMEYIASVAESYKNGDYTKVIEIDREIVITVSLGAAELSVPNVAGKSVEEADSMISEAGFNVTHSYELSETVEKNYVIRTDPEAGVMAASGSTIKIIVSNGPKEVQVPDIKNLTEEAAVSNIESLKLAVGEVKREPSDTVPEGRIISQTIDPSASVPEGTPIGFTVSTGRAVKTFSATVSGEITPYDGGTVSKYIQESGGSIHIVVSFDDGKEKHTIVDQDLNAGSFPFNVNQTFTGLEGNEGSVLIIINDQAGNEITSMFDVDKVRNVTYTAE
ncbi:MAG: PASTA domain-containing protein, partial [Lachnospiraceae bacterium]|nr:PASTA domain-containing protein [Lachnospiraceae bacterium]